MKDEKIYKYRSDSIISIKELYYGEMYLSHVSELNDPYDTKILYKFSANKERYQRLLETIESGLDIITKKIDFGEIAGFLAKEELSYEELIEKIQTDYFRNTLVKYLGKNKNTECIAVSDIFIRELLYSINKWVTKNIYVSSFTKNFSDPIMWSHYANEHRGFCLQFCSTNNQLYENPFRRAKKTRYKDGTYGYQEGKKFHFDKVKYKKNILALDGFMNFSPYIYGENKNKPSIDNFWNKFKESALIKYNKWKYEEEYRIIDYSDWMPNKVDENGVKKKNFIDRVFFYDQTQLTGIIFGSKMDANKADEIEILIHRMRQNVSWECNECLPIFIFYKAVIDHNNYNMKTKPLYGLDHKNNKFNIEQLKEKEEELQRNMDIINKYCKDYKKDHHVYKGPYSNNMK